MAGKVKPIPEGYHTVTPILSIKGAAEALDFYKQAFGAKLIRPVQNQFYGDRTGSIEDPFGHSWHVATHVEDVPPEELQRRAAQQHQHT